MVAAVGTWRICATKDPDKLDHPETATCFQVVTGAKLPINRHVYTPKQLLSFSLIISLLLTLLLVIIFDINATEQGTNLAICALCDTWKNTAANISFLIVNNYIMAEAAVRPVQGIKPPHVLNIEGNIQENWKIFKQKWTNYSVITNLDQQNRAYKTALLLHTLGDEALRIYNGFQFDTAEDERTTEEIITKFDDFAIGDINITYERFVFNKRNQNDGETFETFLTALRVLIRSCDYCVNCVQSITRDRIVLGIRDKDTQSDLLKERALTLNKCIDICRAAENASSQVRCIHPETLHKVTTSTSKKGSDGKHRNKKHNKPNHTGASGIERECKFCANKHQMKKEFCPAYGKICISIRAEITRLLYVSEKITT